MSKHSTDSVKIASSATQAQIAAYANLKRQEDEIKRLIAEARVQILADFDSEDTDKFTDNHGEVIASKVDVENKSFDMDLIRAKAPATYAAAMRIKVGPRLNLPRIKR